jgi:hypothetical protein
MPASINRNCNFSVLFALLLLDVTCIVRASETIPVRPGLWEISTSGPSITDQIKSTPPDKRQAMEQAAGISIRGDKMVRRVCIPAELITQGFSVKRRTGCDLRQVWNGKTSKITYLCANGSSVHGELTYPNKESYSGWMDSKNSKNAKKSVRVLQSGKWMAKDCAAKNN